MNTMKLKGPGASGQAAAWAPVPPVVMAGFPEMAKVLLTTLASEDERDKSFKRGPLVRLKESAGSEHCRHVLVDDPAEADIILFAEIHVRFAYNIRHHPLYRQFRNKTFAFASDDYLIPMVPGVYASLEKTWYSPRRTRAGCYLSMLENPHTGFDPAPVERDLLCSFVGSAKTWSGRSRLMNLQAPRTLFLDTSREALDKIPDSERDAYWKRYADIARRSKFVLCPRGEGTSSIRLFEMMRMGRAPVIISDQWVAPEGPRWEECSIRIAERDLMRIPQLLEQREAEAEAMGLKARREWERWFSPDEVFNTVVDACIEIQRARRFPESIESMLASLQILRPFFFRAYLRFWKLKYDQRKMRRAQAAAGKQ